MPYELRDGQGSLFKAKPNDNPKWPGYEGRAMISGVEYYISAWVKEGKNGKFFSLAFKPKKGRSAPSEHDDTGERPPF